MGQGEVGEPCNEGECMNDSTFPQVSFSSDDEIANLASGTDKTWMYAELITRKKWQFGLNSMYKNVF